MRDAFLLLASLVYASAVIPYIKDMIRRKTRPNLVSWTTWTLLPGIATAAEIAAHEYRAAVFSGVVMLATALVVICGLRYGFVKYTRFDVACQMGALVGVVLWQIFNSPLVAILATVTVDVIAALPTIRHSWRNPTEETWQTYAIFGLGGLAAIGGITHYNWTNLSYALYTFLCNFIIVGVILTKRKMRAI